MKRTTAIPAMCAVIVVVLAAFVQGPAQARAISASTSSPQPTTAAASQGPCSFITPAEMGSVLGQPVTRQDERAGRRCIYYTADPLVFVDLEVDRESAAESWKGVNTGNAMIGADQEKLSSIGEQAAFGPRDRLYVLSGDVFVAIEAGFDANVRERAKKVASLAVSKLR
jgi:hypothetical protein